MRCKFFNAIGLYRMWRWRIRHAEEEELFLISHTSASFSSETTSYGYEIGWWMGTLVRVPLEGN